MSDFYTVSGTPSTASPGQSSPIRAEFAAIQTAFDKLPALSTNPSEILVVNAGGTAVETVSGPSGTIVGTSDTQTLTNKTINLSSNTLAMTLAQLNTAVSDDNVVAESAKDASGGVVGKTLEKINIKNSAATFTGFIEALLTAARTWTLPDESGTIALVSRVSGRNLTVNGSCQVSQVNGSTIVTPVTGTYPIDNVIVELSQANKLNYSQSSSANYILDGSHSLLATAANQYTPLAGDFFVHKFQHEGLNTAHLKWGTASAKAVSLQFVAYASVAGTYSGSIINAASNRSYPFSFVLPSSTPTLIKIENIPGDTSGTWPTTAALSMSVCFDVGCGTNYKTTGDAWASGAYFGVTGATSLVAQASSSSLSISDVQLEEGSLCSLFERKSYQQNFAECYRYLPSITSETTASFVGAAMKYSTTEAQVAVPFMYPARTNVTGIVASGGGILSVRDTSFNYEAATGINFTRGSKTACELNLTGLSGVAGGNGSMCIFNSATGTIFFTGAQI